MGIVRCWNESWYWRKWNRYLSESSYASIYSTNTPRRTRNHLNHGYQQSIELTEDQAAVVRRSYLRNSVNSSGSHFYDSVQSTSRPNTGLSCSIYSMPEADYSLIMEQRQTKVSYQALKVRLGIAYHLHSQKRHRLETSCGFYRPDAICQKVSVDQACWLHQTCCNLIFADLLQVDETTCIKPACSSQLPASLQTTYNRLVIIKPEQAMRNNASWYRLGDSRLAATCAFLAV